MYVLFTVSYFEKNVTWNENVSKIAALCSSGGWLTISGMRSCNMPVNPVCSSLSGFALKQCQIRDAVWR